MKEKEEKKREKEMVFFFTSIADPSYTIFMGKNKDENELLLRYCWPEDVWFHVDDHSSAHVYLRLKPGQTIDDIPKLVSRKDSSRHFLHAAFFFFFFFFFFSRSQVLVECCQLVKV